MKKILTVSFF